jgi:hypothetical protein
VFGLACAIGHHAFYQNLDKQPVDSSLFGQQINIAIGTAFAFLFRASLVIAIGAIYWQIFWRTLLRSRKPLTVSHVDTLSGALGSIFELVNVRAMLRSRTLAALALLSWLIPLAALLPPATLSIQNSIHVQSFKDDIPVLNLSAATMFQEERSPSGLVYKMSTGPRLLRLITEVAFDGEVVHASGYETNTTYALQFDAPAVRCRSVASEDLETFRDYMLHDCRGYNYTKLGHEMCGLDYVDLLYNTWSPGNATDWMTTIHGEAGNTIDAVGNGTYEQMNSEDRYGNNHVLVGTRSLLMYSDYGEWDLLNCSLHFATYNAIVSTPMDALSVLSDVTVDFHGLVGDSKLHRAETDGYYVMMKGLIDILRGHIIDSGGKTEFITGEADIMQTTLMFAKELMYSARVIDVEYNWTTADLRGASDNVLPEEAWTASTFNASLAVGIEELFRNVVLSLFSKPSFLSSSTEPRNVTRESWLNVYTYRQKNLLLSYGIAIGGTLLACVIGCTSMYRDNAAYSNKFSTILRTTKLQLTGFDDLLTTRDQRGADPLPKHLANAQFELGGNKPGDGDGEIDVLHKDLPQHLEQDGEQSVMLNDLGENGRPSNVEDVEEDRLTSGTNYSEQYSVSSRHSEQRLETNSEMDVVEDWPTSEQWRRVAGGVGEPRASVGSYQNFPI